MTKQKVDTDKILVSETQVPKCVTYLVMSIFKWQTLKKIIQSGTMKHYYRFLSVKSIWKFKNNKFENYEQSFCPLSHHSIFLSTSEILIKFSKVFIVHDKYWLHIRNGRDTEERRELFSHIHFN